jgi:hypothetical protein
MITFIDDIAFYLSVCMYCKSVEGKFFPKKVDLIGEEMLEKLVYCNINAEREDDEVYVDAYMHYLIKRLSMSKEDSHAYLEAVESEDGRWHIFQF